MPNQPGPRAPKSMVEGLVNIGKEIAGLKYAPDADPDFLTQLETAVIGYVQQRQQGAGSPGAQAGGAAAPPGGAPTPVTDVGGGGAGMHIGPAAPNADELRRVLAGNQ